jgi:acyl-CoA synthetase (NDP forming)
MAICVQSPEGLSGAKFARARPQPFAAVPRPRSFAASGTSDRDGSFDYAIFAQAGVLRTEIADELFDFAVGFSRQPLPKGNRFAVVTNADGPGIMATDAAIRNGLELAKLRPETLETLKAKLPPTANVFSPVTGDGNFSISEEPRVGHEIITNGVKQELLGGRFLGMESIPIITYSSGSYP